jgi:hypothetical protein
MGVRLSGGVQSPELQIQSDHHRPLRRRRRPANPSIRNCARWHWFWRHSWTSGYNCRSAKPPTLGLSQFCSCGFSITHQGFYQVANDLSSAQGLTLTRLGDCIDIFALNVFLDAKTRSRLPAPGRPRRTSNMSGFISFHGLTACFSKEHQDHQDNLAAARAQ